MTLDGCGKFLKYSIFVVNLIIFLVGLVIVSLGIWALVDGANMNRVLGDSTYANMSAVLLTFGGVVAFISFLGCCGALKEVKCLLLTFFIILMLISIVIIAGAVLVFKVKDKVDEAFTDGLLDTMKKYSEDEKIRNSWDEVQSKLKCCGAKLYSDWQHVGMSPPDSCKCTDTSDTVCDKSEHEPSGYWRTGCVDSFKDEIKRHATPLLGVAIAIVVIIVLAMVFSCALFTML